MYANTTDYIQEVPEGKVEIRNISVVRRCRRDYVGSGMFILFLVHNVRVKTLRTQYCTSQMLQNQVPAKD